MMLIWILGEMLVFSAIAFVAFGLDKRAAVRGTSRTPEKTLLLMSLLGGWPGALIARRVFRHKTRKQPFTALLYTTIAFHLIAAAAVLWLLPPSA